MERLHITLPNIAMSFAFLHALIMCCCNAFPQFDLVTANTTVTEGETLTLQCRFSERIGDGYSVYWKKAAIDYIGYCRMDHDPGDECSMYSEFSDDSRFTLASSDQQFFQLMISNIDISDTESYTCELYLKNNSKSLYQSSRVLEVLVVPLPTIYVPESSGHISTPNTKQSSTKLTSTSSATGSTMINTSSIKTSPWTSREYIQRPTMTLKSSSKIHLTTKDGKTKQAPQVTHSNFLRTSTSYFPPEIEMTDTTPAQHTIPLYCAVAVASTLAVLFAFVACCRKRLMRISCRTGTTKQISLKTVKQDHGDQSSPPCFRAYEEIEPSYSDANEIYHDLDDQIQETSLDVLKYSAAPNSSQGNISPEYDRAITSMLSDTNEGNGKDGQSAFYHVIDIPDSGEQYINYSTENLYLN